MQRYLHAALIVVLLLWAGDAHALSFVSDDNSNTGLYYIPITLTNNQGSSIPSGTEVCIGTGTNGIGCNAPFNPAPYTKFINASASNVNFQDGAGTLLNSWIETPGATTNGPILWWVKLNSAISANSSLTIYMVIVAFGSSSMNSTPNHTGAGPLYTGTYGQFDNGSNVFATQYQDFKGTSTPAGWTLTQSAPTADYTINNGIWIYHQCAQTQGSGPCVNNTTNGTVVANTGLNTGTSPAIQNVIAEWYAGGTSGENQQPVFVGTADSGGNLVGGAAAAIDYEHAALTDRVSAALGLLVLPNSALTGTPNTQFPYPLFVDSVYTSNSATAGNTAVGFNYGALDSPAGAASPGTNRFLSFNESNEICCIAYTPFVAYWARWRSYPPNGIEPTASYGQLVTLATGAPPSVSPGGYMSTGKVVTVSPVQSQTAGPPVHFIGTGGALQWVNGGAYYQSTPLATNPGDTVVVAMEITASSPPATAWTITTPGITWNATALPSPGSGNIIEIFYAFNVPGGNITFTTNQPGNNTNQIYQAVAFGGGNGTIDQTVTATTTHVAATTTSAHEVAICAVSRTQVNPATALTPEPGFTLLPLQFLSASAIGFTSLLNLTYQADTGAAGSKTGGSSTGAGNSIMVTFPTVQPLPPLAGGALQ